MNIKKILLLTLFFFLVSSCVPETARAFTWQGVIASGNSIVVKIREQAEYFFAFRVENKVEVLEKQAENSLDAAKNYAAAGNEEKVPNQIQDYLQKKEDQNVLLEKTSKAEVLEKVEARTIEQQKTMEEIKTKVDEGVKQEVVQVQEKVVNQVAEKIVVADGKEGVADFFQKVEHVWAPGTSAGGESGVVVEGGTMQFAPGTSGGGSSGADIRGVEVKGN